MLSRVAENIYWMARYIERTENTARLIMVNTNLLLDLTINQLVHAAIHHGCKDRCHTTNFHAAAGWKNRRDQRPGNIG